MRLQILGLIHSAFDPTDRVYSRMHYSLVHVDPNAIFLYPFKYREAPAAYGILTADYSRRSKGTF